ncbi:hypothetical protein Nepgr_015510 [Nepenthes gracilis]|uniref:tRNA (adenine(58)-N(1))-methyltransferase non-catalytic subunit TRM6 n=1 Tax=Nepenthes gracilis TaxID=150966 RepID=A0AAD3SMY0_NEPGR|nr:hypothetical protein Nepgr_015510 [Nepenthes gracilis]
MHFVKWRRVTWEGCSVLLDINDGDRLVFARLSPASTLKIGKKNCSLKPLIGCPFGSLFKVENGKDGLFLLRIFHTEESNNIEEEEDGISEDVSKDNREIVDNNTAQRLTDQDIHAMQRQGATGDEIVEALITHSATFEKKTSFSQAKYRLRKQKKYAPKVLLRRPFARSICEAYFKKYPSRIGFLRLDALSLLLTMANVTAYSDILVVDMVGGLLTGAVAERLGGTGYVCNAYSGATPYPMDIARIFNFSNEICERIVRCCLTDLCPVLNGTCELVNQSKDACNSKTEQKEKLSSCESVSMEQDIVAEDGVPEVIAEKAAPLALKPSKSAKAGEGASDNLINLWKERGFSSLLIAAPELDAWSILQKLLPLLSYSAPFAIYHQYLQPLATCMHHLQIEKLAVGLQISEPWLREYQVLPSRTHPCMQMSAFGGYILSGTRTCTYDAHSH